MLYCLVYLLGIDYLCITKARYIFTCTDNYSFHFQNHCAVKINDKKVSDSDWFGVEHVEHTVDFYRFFGMETLCKLYPELFPPKVWLSKDAPKIGQPKKKLVKRC